MQFVSDPLIPVKIRKMQQRIKWRSAPILERGIDQTQLVIDDDQNDQPEFSFLVIGDTGAGPEHHHNPQRQVAQHMLSHLDDCRFTLHTGDVVYLVGSSEYYLDNFIKPYKEWLVGGDHPERITHNQMVFQKPILPVLGNHDYYDLPPFQGLLTGATLPLRRLARFRLDFDIGWHGSYQGEAYAQAFLDCLNHFKTPDALNQHLNQHYTAKTSAGYALHYQPGHFTRLPNRYYTFRYGGIDFFALDSNTFNAPQAIPQNSEGVKFRQALETQQIELDQQKQSILDAAQKLNPNRHDEADQLSDLRAKIEQIDEQKLDINKQLMAKVDPDVDVEQLEWLEQRLIESWHDPDVRGRILYLHHPPYVTEATKWDQSQTLAVRHQLRQVFDKVNAVIKAVKGDRPIADLVLCGHAHCLESIRTLATGHGDAHMNWLICGGGGFSLRRQRKEGEELRELFPLASGKSVRPVARSQFFIGKSGHAFQARRPYSFLRIDVCPGTPPKFVIRPFITERFQHQWNNIELTPFTL